MKRSAMLALFMVVVAAAGVVSPGTVFGEPANSVNLSLGGVLRIIPHCDATVYSGEYERTLGPTISVLGRGSGVVYTFDDGTYREHGNPKGIDMGMRYYPAGGGMKGLYFGGALGYWKWDWTFTENKGRTSEKQGRGDSTAVRADVELGARFPIGSSSVAVMPALHIGKFFTSDSCEYDMPPNRAYSSCNRATEIRGGYVFLAVSVGVGF